MRLVSKLLSSILGSGDSITKIADNIATGLDKLSLTEQEKVELSAKDRAEARAFIIAESKSNSAANKTRRLYALAFGFVFLLLVVSQSILSAVAPFFNDAITLYDAVEQSSKSLLDTIDYIAPWVGGITALWFGVNPVKKIADNYTANKSK